MILHTVFISYHRRELTEQTLDSYYETVTVPHTVIVVDNGSDAHTVEWLMEADYDYTVLLLGENRYPGYACNRGFERAPTAATHFQRSDNDFRFLPGWCEHVERRFRRPNLGQLGLRTDEEEMFAATNVGGNMIIRREVWEQGLRYDERPWTSYLPGYSEDTYYSPTLQKMGWQWARAKRPCIESLATGDWRDPYYQKSYGDRRIVPHPLDPTAPGTV